MKPAAATPSWRAFLARDNAVWEDTWALLGGEVGWGWKPSGPWDVHCRAREGVPYRALAILMTRLDALEVAQVFEALRDDADIGQRDTSARTSMTPGLAARVWELAHVLASATERQGSRDAAQDWLRSPTSGLGANCPMGLLRTAQGTKLILAHLQNLALKA